LFSSSSVGCGGLFRLNTRKAVIPAANNPPNNSSLPERFSFFLGFAVVVATAGVVLGKGLGVLALATNELGNGLLVLIGSVLNMGIVLGVLVGKVVPVYVVGVLFMVGGVLLPPGAGNFKVRIAVFYYLGTFR